MDVQISCNGDRKREFNALLSSYIIIVNTYRPPLGSIVMFLDELIDLICSNIVTSNDKLVLCGDLNCPGIDNSRVNDDLQWLLESVELD